MCLRIYIFSTLSPAAETKLHQHRKVSKAYGNDDVILLMKIIQQCSVLTPLDIPDLAREIREKRNNLYQRNKSMDYFCEKFNQLVADLVELDRPTREEDLIVEFVNHLLPSYCNIITQWKGCGVMPTALDAVQLKLQEYESTTAIAQSHAMTVSRH